MRSEYRSTKTIQNEIYAALDGENKIGGRGSNTKLSPSRNRNGRADVGLFFETATHEIRALNVPTSGPSTQNGPGKRRTDVAPEHEAPENRRPAGSGSDASCRRSGNERTTETESDGLAGGGRLAGRATRCGLGDGRVDDAVMNCCFLIHTGRYYPG